MKPQELIFEILCTSGEWPDMDNITFPQLGCFFPYGSTCEQVNYGQGEGQVLIDGREWGFYFNTKGNLDVVLHNTDLCVEEAHKIMNKICETLSHRQKGTFEYRLTKGNRKEIGSGM